MGTAHVLSFHKTNGLSSEFGGIKMYQMDFEAEVHYDGLPAHNEGVYPVMIPAQPPVTRTEKGSLNFQKTEKGWQGGDRKIY